MNDETKIIADKLDILIKLTAINALEGKESKEQILLLNSLGMAPVEIGDILGIKPNTVSAALYRERKQNTKEKKETK